jgi:hypothetical protein
MFSRFAFVRTFVGSTHFLARLGKQHVDSIHAGAENPGPFRGSFFVANLREHVVLVRLDPLAHLLCHPLDRGGRGPEQGGALGKQRFGFPGRAQGDPWGNRREPTNWFPRWFPARRLPRYALLLPLQVLVN